MDKKTLPKGRFGRLARLAATSARTAGSLLRSGDASHSAAKTAAVLGQLRGLATKVGQMASYVDGLVPEQHRDAYETGMAKLQSATPTSSPESIRARVEEELGAPLDTLFAEWEDAPIASASIGQVHRARLPDGRQVAVKIQHPGITEALEADLRNAGLIETGFAAFGLRRFDSKRMLEELRTRFREELDYQLEADRQRAFTQIHAGIKDVVIPTIIDDRSTRRVLTSTFVEGLPFAEARDASAEERAAWAATLWGFVYRSTLVGGLFNADPHPGNYLFQPDGRVAFLDFGCVQPLSEAHRRRAVRLHRAAHRQDQAAFDQGVIDLLELRGGRYQQRAIEYSRASFRPLTESPFHLTQSYAAGLVETFKQLALDMRKGSADDNLVPLPEGMLFINRLQFGFYSVLARLDVEVDYRKVERSFIEAAGDGIEAV